MTPETDDLLAFQRQCYVAELAALHGISKAVHACINGHASTSAEGHGDTAAYQAS